MNYLNKFLNISCLDFLEKCEKNSFDYVITSPPYNGVHASRTSEYNCRTYDVYSGKEKDYFGMIERLAKLIHEKMNDFGVFILNISYTGQNKDLYLKVAGKIIENGFSLIDTICWKKSGAASICEGRQLTRIWEPIFVFSKKGFEETFKDNRKRVQGKNGHLFYKNNFNFVEAKNNDGQCKLNCATYSSDLVKFLLDIYVPEGKIVFDPFMGTGTTGVCCSRMKRNFIGTEISKDQVDFSNRRLLGENVYSVEVKTSDELF